MISINKNTKTLMDRELPIDYLVNDGSLFGGGTTEVDACGFDAFMTHKVGEKGEVVEAVEKVLCEAMSE